MFAQKIRFIIRLFILTTIVTLCVISCKESPKGAEIPGTDGIHRATNSMYYWRTVFKLSDAESEFLKDNQIGRIYLRMFDVVEGYEQLEPNATIQFEQDVPDDIEIVPTVFITVDAIRRVIIPEGVDSLASKIIERIKHMCSWHDIKNWHEIQLDCDWTEHTRKPFYALCRSVKEKLSEDMLVSSTIRLHQLRQEEPPVDYGVLMVYNTDNFRDPYATNSILNDSTVEDYVASKLDFKLPLDIALPIYQWHLIFDDKGNFKRIDDYSWSYNEGEVRKYECVPYKTLERTQEILKKYLHLQKGHYSTVLYHLDEENLNNYSHEEFTDLFNN